MAEKTSGAELLARFVVGSIFWVLSIVMIAVTVKLAWGWFVVSVFAGLPTIGYVQALGIASIASVLTYHPDPSAMKAKTSALHDIGVLFAVNVVQFLAVCVYHLIQLALG